jgi:hypothetical protein
MQLSIVDLRFPIAATQVSRQASGVCEGSENPNFKLKRLLREDTA